MKTTSARTNISIAPRIREMAEQLMQARAFTDFSGFLAQLIREEWERRHGPMHIPVKQQPTETPKAVADAIAHEVVDEALRAQTRARRKPSPKRE